ncbi:expressed protein [Chlorella variabilis]|uniref:Expressed protein n=1 Tax=Chlorella variabilis TaxID=554065 RepID=E1ZEC4_CHLVA|nr:expressed protein [Chlorella variabilis]EFN56007.1 expressed protein [Chlorella variabilis]|eukprot:XP_005848109.1 expressed protein [Chlorella variabilis]
MGGLALALVAAVLAAASPATFAAETVGPVCTGLAEQMGVEPSLVGAFIGSLPEPPSRSFCSWLTQNQTRQQACDFLALIDLGLTDGGNHEPPRCGSPSTTSLDQASRADGKGGALAEQHMPGSGVLTALRDARPLPPEFEDAAAVFAEEGATYFQLFRFSRNAYVYAPCSPQPNASLPLPPGWSLEATGDLAQASGPPLPMLFVLHNNQTNQVLLVVRSTVGSYEWTKNFEYNQVGPMHTADPEIQAIFGGNVSFGFASIFQEIWPAAQAALDALVVDSGGPPPEVWVTGHSLGAGIGTMVAFAAADYLAASMGPDEAPVVQAVLFAPPQVGDSSFVDAYNQLVNGRMVDYADDIINQVPCDPLMPACPATPSGILGSVGVKGTATDQGNVTSWPYGTVGGELVFLPEDLPQAREPPPCAVSDEPPLWMAAQQRSGMQLCSWQLYMCYLSSFSANPDERDQYCWLSPQPAGTPGSQCPIFPNAWLTEGAPVFGPGTSPSAATAPPPDQEAAAPPPIVAATSAAAPGAAPLTALSALVFMLAVLLLG